MQAEMVTSRLGRGSAAGARAESVAPSTDSEGEIIQWKRGQILGKGAYGTVCNFILVWSVEFDVGLYWLHVKIF